MANSFQNQTDLQDFFCHLLLKAQLFCQDHSEVSDAAVFFHFLKFNRKKSVFTPKPHRFPILGQYIRTSQSKIDNLNTKALKRHNLSTDKQAVLCHLKSHTDIVIKAVDKGGPVVAWDAQCYVSEGDFQLSDSKLYKKLWSNTCNT